jgi:protein involved in plasmid replication-relaxation
MERGVQQHMTDIQPTHRKALNKSQLQILYLLYKFRFGTTELFVKSQNNKISRQYMNVRLRILCEQEYIGRKYDSSYKLSGKPATYHLLPKGIKLLKQRPDDFNPKVLKNIGNDRWAKARFINHCLVVFDICCTLKKLYGDELKFFTGSYLKLPKYEYFPQPLPDAYLSFKQDKAKHFLLDYFESSVPFFVLKRRVKYYVSYAEDNLWSKKSRLPAILFVCDTEELRKKVETEVVKALDRSWEEVRFALATRAELNSADKEIWQQSDKTGQKFSLEDLS